MTTTLTLTGIDVSLALSWKSLRTKEQIGAPDELSAEVNDFREGAPLSVGLFNLLAYPESILAAVVDRDGDIRFSGLVRARRGSKPAKGAIQWGLTGTGWEFLAPKRLVGAPRGDTYMIQEDGDEDRLPTAVATDGAATGTAEASSVTTLWDYYWAFPPIDATTYVFDILPVGAPVPDYITWSGSDLAGATDDLAALGSAGAVWFLRNDAPVMGSAVAPYLALHFVAVALPDEGDEGEDLLAGFPSAEQPIDVAPYNIDNDNPDWGPPDDAAAPGDSILPVSISVDYELGDRDEAVYVRGATGFSLENALAQVIEGGTGWVGTPRQTVWGERYIDAPGAITPAQRDAFGQAHLDSVSNARPTVTIRVVGWHGWHKGQAVRVTDADFGLTGRWFLILGVECIQHDPMGEGDEYTLTLGDVLSPDLGYALRDQRLAEQRKEIAPATKFVPWVGDLLLAPGETAPLTMQLANDAGKAMAVKGVTAQWFLKVNGVNLTNPEDTGEPFYLSALVTVTDEGGQITATLHAGAGATAADAAAPFAKIVGAP